MMETTFKIFALLSPFIAAGLTYFFTIKVKKKDIDIEREKELNTILSNLLNVWHYLTRIESIIEILSSDEKTPIFPKQYLPGIILNTGLLNDCCFRELDESSNALKKYDPITYYRLEGLGKSIDLLRKQYIFPFFNHPKLEKEVIIGGAQSVLSESLNEVEEYLGLVASQINSSTKKSIKSFIDEYLDKDTEETLEELDLKYYEMMMQLLPKELEKPTFEQFKIEADSEEFKQMQEIQMKIALEGTLNEALSEIANNPDISAEELLKKIEKAKQNKT